jgi:hypothetical protein
MAKQSTSAPAGAHQKKTFLNGVLRALLDCFVVASLLLAMTHRKASRIGDECNEK